MSTGGQAVEHARRADAVAASVPPPRAVRQAERQTDDDEREARAGWPRETRLQSDPPSV
jgi:hypothetical protein